jgi:hypothetical protein
MPEHAKTDDSLSAPQSSGHAAPALLVGFAHAGDSMTGTFHQQWLDSWATVSIAASAQVRAPMSRSSWAAEERQSQGLSIDPRTQTARWHGDALPLTRTELRLLGVLTEDLGRVFSYAQISELVWRNSYHYGDIERIRSTLKRLRSKLRSVGAGVEIQVVRGVGLCASVEDLLN